MSNEKLGNEAPSDAARPASPTRLLPTEVEYLQGQVAQARAAMAHVVRQMPRDIERNPTLQAWAQEHPFVTTGSAAGIGFLVGTLIAPHRHNGTAPPARTAAEQSSPPSSLKATLVSMVSEPVLQAVQAALVSWTMSLLSKPADAGDRESTGEPDGHPPGP